MTEMNRPETMKRTILDCRPGGKNELRRPQKERGRHGRDTAGSGVGRAPVSRNQKRTEQSEGVRPGTTKWFQDLLRK